MANLEFSNYIESRADAGGTLDGTEILIASKAGEAVQFTTQELIDELGGGGGGGTWGSITGTLSNQTDLNNALGLKADLTAVSNGLAAVDTTGTAIAFAIPQFYASSGTPATGNVTLVTTGLVKGMLQVLFHDDSSEPTWPAAFVRKTGFYIPNTLNTIYMHAISATEIHYFIFQDL